MAAIREMEQQADPDYLVEDIGNMLGECREGLDRVRTIVRDLKGLSRQSESEWEWADLHQGLDATLNIVWNQLKYHCELHKEYGELPQVYCLPTQLNQVFLNLLVNAAQSIGEQGHIHLRTGADEQQVWVEVQDTGSGIAPENLKHIFEPFFTTKPRGEGTGLGLSLSYGIVKRHGGRIEVQSEPGQGTLFRVVLPLRPPQADAGHD
jgi:signal transduction histidine kinase